MPVHDENVELIHLFASFVEKIMKKWGQWMMCDMSTDDNITIRQTYLYWKQVSTLPFAFDPNVPTRIRVFWTE
jgi:hypothetical protein